MGEPARAPLPRRIGRYTLIRRIAAGGMGELFLGLALGPAAFRKLVAVKTLHPHLAENEKFVEMFLDEARLAARLTHANIVQTFELGEEGGTYFMAMEYVHGVSLSEVLRRGELPVEVALMIGIGAAGGLAFAHTARDEQGRDLAIVHRDVAPKNILCSFGGEVKVADFGVARAADQIHDTATGEVKGTMTYMAPEQLDGERVDARADVYAMGVTLYGLFTGRQLFRGIPHSKLFDRAIRREVPPPSKLREQLPGEIDTVVLRALSLEPALRQSSCAELLRDLRQVAAKLGVVPAPEPVSELMKARFPEHARGLLSDEEIAAAEGHALDRSMLDKPTASGLAVTEEGAQIARSAELQGGARAAEPGSGVVASLVAEPPSSVQTAATPSHPSRSGAPASPAAPAASTAEPGSPAAPLPLVQRKSGPELSLPEAGEPSWVSQRWENSVTGPHQPPRREPSQTLATRPALSGLPAVALGLLVAAVAILGFLLWQDRRAPSTAAASSTAASAVQRGPDASARAASPDLARVAAANVATAAPAVAPPKRAPGRRPARPADRGVPASPVASSVKISISSRPSGAVVLCDGVDEGRTPLVISRPRDPARSLGLLLRADDHLPARRNVSLGSDAQLEVVLLASEAPPEPKPKPKPKRDPLLDDLK